MHTTLAKITEMRYLCLDCCKADPEEDSYTFSGRLLGNANKRRWVFRCVGKK